MGRVVAIGRVCALAGLAAVALVGCASDPDDVPIASVPVVAVTNPPSVVKTGVIVQVYALDNNFRARNTTVKVGDTVQWTNRGKNDHDVLPKVGNDWGVQIAGFHPKDTYEFTFTKPGVYAYYCSIHGAKAGSTTAGMIGTITVTG